MAEVGSRSSGCSSLLTFSMPEERGNQDFVVALVSSVYQDQAVVRHPFLQMSRKPTAQGTPLRAASGRNTTVPDQVTPERKHSYDR